MELTCPQCGAENYESARYCRKCGFQFGSAEFHEAPTRSFDEQRRVDPVVERVEPAEPVHGRGFDTFGSRPLPGEPARYVPPPAPPGPLQAGVTHMPVRADTAPMTGPVSKGPNVFLIIGAIVLALFVGGAVLSAVIAHAIRAAKDAARDKAVSSGPATPGKGKTAPPSAGSDEDSIDPDTLPQSLQNWYYDGASVPFYNQNGASAVLIMKTDEDVDDVAEFYRDKFSKPPAVTRGGKAVILSGDAGQKVTVVVERGDEGDDDEDQTNIVVTIGTTIPIPPIPGIPPVPNVPSVRPEVAPPAMPTPPTPPAVAPAAPSKEPKKS